MRKGFEEADIREGLAKGGAVTQALVVVRSAPVAEEVTYVAYLRVSWRVGYHLLHLSRFKGERVYRNLGRLVFMLQEDFGAPSPLQLYRAGAPELQRFRNLQPRDLHGFAGPRAVPAGFRLGDPASGKPDSEEGGEQ